MNPQWKFHSRNSRTKNQNSKEAEENNNQPTTHATLTIFIYMSLFQIDVGDFPPSAFFV